MRLSSGKRSLLAGPLVKVVVRNEADFFVSRAGADAATAELIADITSEATPQTDEMYSSCPERGGLKGLSGSG
jgi:hypothetical protein